MSATCKSCGAPILWAKTEAGRKMPVDAEPAAKGNLVLLPQVDDPKTPLALALNDRQQIELRATHVPTYVSHFATCPDAEQYRRDG